MTGQAPTTAPTTSDWWGSRHGMTQPASSASTSRYLFVDDGGRRRGVRDLVVLVAGAPGAIGSWIARHFAAGGPRSRSRTAQIETRLSTWRQNGERGAVLPRTNKAGSDSLSSPHAVARGGWSRTRGRYSTSWMRPSKVRLSIMSSATSG